MWGGAILDLLSKMRSASRFELMDDGNFLAWEHGPGAAWKAKVPPRQHGGPGVP
jgi:hypothetical protein